VTQETVPLFIVVERVKVEIEAAEECPGVCILIDS